MRITVSTPPHTQTLIADSARHTGTADIVIYFVKEDLMSDYRADILAMTRTRHRLS